MQVIFKYLFNYWTINQTESGNGWHIDDTIFEESEGLILLDGNIREYTKREVECQGRKPTALPQGKSCFFAKLLYLYEVRQPG